MKLKEIMSLSKDDYWSEGKTDVRKIYGKYGDNEAVAYLKEELGALALIKGHKGFFLIFSLSRDIYLGGYDYKMSRIHDLKVGYSIFTKAKNVVIQDTELYNQFIKKIMLEDLNNDK